jgi:tRNA 5-methylaminomethyl-2-thiouridine biosynthesis bifunctional protein
MTESLSPRSAQFDDIYFAVEDGWAESQHVFIYGNNLPAAWENKTHFVIAETGFGTGLNFLAAWKRFEETAAPHQKLHFISFEKYPLAKEDIHRYLSAWKDQMGMYLDRLLELYPLRVSGWHPISLSSRVTLTLIFDDVLRAMPELNSPVDCWFLDGHDPAKNPDMWSETVFQAMAKNSHTGTSFATFTAAGFVRRGLAACGFDVKKTKGFGRKRDMTVGVFTGGTPPQPLASLPQKIAVVGGGIAGASVAHSLSLRGLSVDLYEGVGIASAGSGNPRGLFNPRFTAARGAESDFYSPAFALGHRTFHALQKQQEIGFRDCGSLHLVTDNDKSRRFEGMSSSWGWHEDHLAALSAEEASEQAKVSLTHNALFLPQAGVVSPALTVPLLTRSATVYSEHVDSLDQKNSGWEINARPYDAVILASGAGSAKFEQTSWLPIHTVRGQISIVKTSDVTRNLRSNLCYGGYCSIAYEDCHVVGSTFQPWLTETTLREEDHTEIMEKLSGVSPDFSKDMTYLGGRAALRVAAKDRVPLIGPVPDKSAWEKGDETDWHGLYITTAHGSHGLISALLGAEILTRMILQEPQATPSSTLAHLSPARFLHREKRKKG